VWGGVGAALVLATWEPLGVEQAGEKGASLTVASLNQAPHR
jgi:hypothetical protein